MEISHWATGYSAVAQTGAGRTKGKAWQGADSCVSMESRLGAMKETRGCGAATLERTDITIRAGELAMLLSNLILLVLVSVLVYRSMPLSWQTLLLSRSFWMIRAPACPYVLQGD